MSLGLGGEDQVGRMRAGGSFLREIGLALALSYGLIAVWGALQFQQLMQLWWTLALFFFAIIGPFVGMFVAPWAPLTVVVAVVLIGAIGRSRLDGRMKIALYLVPIIGWFVAGTVAFSIYVGPR